MTGRRRAWKAVRPDGSTRNGFSWEVGIGGTVQSDRHLDPANPTACPTRPGDGLCLAKTWEGAALAGFTTSRCLVVEFDADNVLGEDADKLRVRGPVSVLDVYDAQRLLRDGWGAGANLAGANLTHADLTRADLAGADLTHAFLTHADLTGADLTHADLAGADLTRADLTRAYLTGANLTGANLTGADLDWHELVARGAIR